MRIWPRLLRIPELLHKAFFYFWIDSGSDPACLVDSYPLLKILTSFHSQCDDRELGRNGHLLEVTYVRRPSTSDKLVCSWPLETEGV